MPLTNLLGFLLQIKYKIRFPDNQYTPQFKKEGICTHSDAQILYSNGIQPHGQIQAHKKPQNKCLREISMTGRFLHCQYNQERGLCMKRGKRK